jgi:hypothetical protein
VTNLKDSTTSQLRSIIAIKVQIEALQSQIESIVGVGDVSTPFAEEASAPAKRKYQMTAAHRRKLAKALAKARKIRWAKAKTSKQDKSKPAQEKDRRSSPATRTKLAAAAKARWAKVRAEGKTTL